MINAGLAIIDEVGVEALTIRNVAKRAGAPAMTLYTHFDTKEQLLDLIHEEVARRVYADSGRTTWQTEIQALCRQIHAVLIEHPHWAPLLVRPAPPLDLPIRERLLSMMMGDGMPAPKALAGYSAAILLAFGLTLAELTIVTPQGDSSASRRFDRVKEWVAGESRDAYPATRAAFAETPHFDVQQNLDYTIRGFLRGLEAELQSQADMRTAD